MYDAPITWNAIRVLCRLTQHRETEQYTLSTDDHKRNDFDALFTCLDVF